MTAREWDMKQILVTLGVLAASAGAALAGGIDRSGQGISPLFEAGGYAELSFGYVRPSLSGNDVAAFGGSAIGNVASSFMVPSFALPTKWSLTGRPMAWPIVADEPIAMIVPPSSMNFFSGGMVLLDVILPSIERYSSGMLSAGGS